MHLPHLWLQCSQLHYVADSSRFLNCLTLSPTVVPDQLQGNFGSTPRTGRTTRHICMAGQSG